MLALGVALLAMGLALWGTVLVLAGPVLAGFTLVVPVAVSLVANRIARRAGVDRRGRNAAWLASAGGLSATALFAAGSALCLVAAHREAVRVGGGVPLLLVLAAIAQVGWVLLGVVSGVLRRSLGPARDARSSADLDCAPSLAVSLQRAAGVGEGVSIRLHPDARCDLVGGRLHLGLALLHRVDLPALRVLVTYASARDRASKRLRAQHALVDHLQALDRDLGFARELTYVFGPVCAALALALLPLRRVDQTARRSARELARREVRRGCDALDRALVLAHEGARSLLRSTCRARRSLPGHRPDNVYRALSPDACACDDVTLLGEMGPPDGAAPIPGAVYRAAPPGPPVARTLGGSLRSYERAFTAHLLSFVPVDVALARVMRREGRRSG